MPSRHRTHDLDQEVGNSPQSELPAELDTVEPGHALAGDVAAAVDDVDDIALVTCVLNAVDDAVEHFDASIRWGLDSIRHLRPLLDRARRAGRTVVLTSDHGHVIERRTGTLVPHDNISSARSRPGDGAPASDGEVLVTGRRVLAHNNRAVLAVDEDLRYGPLKAGYHGGASPAEVIVPVCVLASSSLPEGIELREAGPQEPAWWHDPALPSPDVDRADAASGASTGAQPMLVDVPLPAEQAAKVAKAVVDSPRYQAQKKLLPKGAFTDQQIADLLASLLQVPGRRLRPHQVAAALKVSPFAVRDAIAQASRLLNVEGFPILDLDTDGETVILDGQLLREQFEIRG